MRTFLLSSFSRHFKVFSLLGLLLLMLGLSFKAFSDYEAWIGAKAKFNEWQTNNGPKCERIFSEAEKILEAPSICKFDTSRPLLFLECKEQEKQRKTAAIAIARESDCPTSGNLFGDGLPLLLGLHDPGSFWEYSLEQRGNPKYAAIVVAVASVVTGLLFLADLTKRFLLESNLGWRRLTVVVSALISVLAFAFYCFDADDPVPEEAIGIALLALISSFVVFGYGRIAVLWIGNGFSEAKETRRAESPHVSTSANRPARAIADQRNISPAPCSESLALSDAGYWPRLWARCFDLPFAWIFGSVIGAFLPDFRSMIQGVGGIVADTFIGMVFICLAIFVYEVFFLTQFGATPGKMIFGLTVRSVDYRLPNLEEAKKRAWIYLRSGLYFTLFMPYMQFLSAYYAWKRKDQAQPWEMAAKTVTLQKPLGTLHFYVGVFVAFCLFSLAFGTHHLLKEQTKNEVRQTIFNILG